jgi:hypothetical protein
MSSLVLSRIFLAPFLPQFCPTVVPGILVFVSVAVFFLFLVHFISFVVNFYLSVWINRSGGAQLLGTTLRSFGEALCLWMLPLRTRLWRESNRIELEKKAHRHQTTDGEAFLCHTSSGSTGTDLSRHFLRTTAFRI